MPTESFLVTALPHSAAPDEEFHVSLFITHRLTPDATKGVVADFPRIVDWTSRLATADFSLQGRTSGGTIVAVPVTPLLDALDPDLWPKVFPKDLAVLPWQVPDHTAVPWRTFAAHRMQQHALLTHAVSMFSSPTAPPTASGNALTPFLLAAMGVNRDRFTIEDAIDGGFDAEITERFDEMTGQGFLGQGGVESSVQQPLLQLVGDVHEARRYYQREEEQRPYSDTPVPGATLPDVDKPEPDFHKRAGMLGDLSPLLRALGLIVDLQVDDVSILDDLTWIQADVVVPDLDNAVKSQPTTACEVSGEIFTVPSESEDWHRGMLRVGDEETFTVLDLDPDAAGLKLEQYVRTVPRLVAAENNGDPDTAAPGSLRAAGFAVARRDRAEALHDRLDDAATKDAALMAGGAAPLHLEQVARGIRFEVWDDESSRWHSLHRRLLDVAVDGAGLVLDDVPDVGFLQGAALTQAEGQPNAPVNAHEVLAGWEGWSLSAPRPGRVVVHDNGEEQVLEAPPPDPDPVNPVLSSTEVESGTLPRLRYGRRYAFRAYSVDLAGNSRPHTLPGLEDTDDSAAGPAASFAQTTLASKPLEATITARTRSADAVGGVLRDQVRRIRPTRFEGPIEGAGAPGLELHDIAPTGEIAVDRVIASRLATRAVARPAAPVRRDRIERAFDATAEESPHLLVRTDLQTPAEVVGNALTTALGSAPAPAAALGDLVAEIAQVITTPRPFLRWEPLIEPAVVPRAPYSEGESLLRLVIRTGVEPPAEGETAVGLVDPETYAAQTIAAFPALDLAWRSECERHLLPPKASQLEAEMLGMFDAAIGSGSPSAVEHALAVALRESGTLLDVTIADLSAPGQRIPQPGVSFHTSPTSEVPEHTDPADLPKGAPLTAGQYVVHDVDTLAVPYLSDPLAAGVSLTFPDAGKDSRLVGLLAVEGVTLRYPGDWPEPTPYRLILESGERLEGRVDGHDLHIAVPPGERLRMRMASCVARESLELFGLWMSLPQAFRDLDILAEAAADGWFWWLTPAADVTLVHAVPRPVEVPRPTLLLPVRAPASTAVSFIGAVDVHGPSTERIDVEASWSEWVDDVAKDEPERVSGVAAAYGTPVGYDEDLVVLTGADGVFPLPDGTSIRLHAAVHQMGDTHHRVVDYRVRATTRYKEYFAPQVLPTVDDVSVVSEPRTISVPSSARPPKAVVRDVLPLFRWEEETEPDQPFALRRTRRSGLRIYLDRPWYATGDGELLGVLLAFGSDAGVLGSVSQWGSDPVWLQAGPKSRAALPLIDLLHLAGLDDRIEAGRPAMPPVARTLVDVKGDPAVWVLGYQPEFSVERGLWFVDVAFDPGSAFWPFVRLAVARFQPDSLPGLHLSPVTMCDFAQLTPERTATLSRPDDEHARIVVTGPVGHLRNASLSAGPPPPFLAQVNQNREMRARLERRVPAVGTDLGWQTVAQTTLPILGIDGTVVSWTGQLELPEALPPRRPGDDANWRVVVEEWERFHGDPGVARVGGPRRAALPELRICYADHLPL